MKREEQSFRQRLAKLDSGIQKRPVKICASQMQIETLAKRYEKKEINLLEFLRGLSTTIAKSSKTAI